MKKIICVLLALLCAITLFSCAKKNSDIAKNLEEDIPTAYAGKEPIEDKITLGSLEIVIKEKTFYINGNTYFFKDFEGHEKLTSHIDDDMIDIYVTDGKLVKCVVYKPYNTVVTEYSLEGKAMSCTKNTIDEYGNAVLSQSYDSEGKLTSFFTASYSVNCDMLEKRQYNADYDLVSVTKYEYDESDKLVREIVYDSKLKLKDVKEY